MWPVPSAHMGAQRTCLHLRNRWYIKRNDGGARRCQLLLLVITARQAAQSPASCVVLVQRVAELLPHAVQALPERVGLQHQRIPLIVEQAQ